jgi:hypothetical protein
MRDYKSRFRSIAFSVHAQCGHSIEHEVLRPTNWPIRSFHIRDYAM